MRSSVVLLALSALAAAQSSSPVVRDDRFHLNCASDHTNILQEAQTTGVTVIGPEVSATEVSGTAATTTSIKIGRAHV